MSKSTRNHLFKIILALAALALLSASECPFAQSPPGDALLPDAGAGSVFVVDFGGQTGTNWQVTYDNEFAVTLRAGSQIQTVNTTLASGPLLLGGMVFDLGHFCFRIDVVCPHRVLTTPMRIRQLVPEQPRQLTIGVTSQGPLAGIPNNVVTGVLQNSDAHFPLAVGSAATGVCALAETSQMIVVADTAVPVDAGVDVSGGDLPLRRPTSLIGRITVSYTGNCATIGGSGNVAVQTMVEITATFTATR